MRYKDPLFHAALGNHEIVLPRPGETQDELLKRLRRLARSYRVHGRAFRVEPSGSGALWWRVEPGEHTKLAWWYRLMPGESFIMSRSADQADYARAQATARYLRRMNKGQFSVSLEGTDLKVCKLRPVT